MNKILLRLINIYFKQILSGFGEKFFKDNLKETKIKKVLKKVGIIILIVYGFGSIIITLSYFSYLYFQGIHSIGEQQIQIGNRILNRLDIASLSLTLIVVVIGILNGITTFFSINYFLSLTSSDEYLLTLPIEEKILFSSKTINISLTNSFFFMIITFVQLIIYGFIEKAGIDFYIISFFLSIIINLYSSLLAIAISLFIINLFKFLKNKDLMIYLSIFIVLPILIVYNIISQKFLLKSSNLNNIFIEIYSKNHNTIKLFQIIFSPLFLFFNYIINNLIKEKTAIKFLHYLIQSGILFLIYKLVIIIFSPIYKKLLILTNIGREIKGYRILKKQISYKRKKPIFSLLIKEILSVYREPNYLLNGPFVMILLPVILFITFYFSAKSSNDIKNLIINFSTNQKEYFTIINIAIIASFLMGGFTNITSTAISREGKNFSILKTIPLRTKDYIFSKLFHGIFYNILSSLFISILLFIVTKINFVAIFFIILISILSSILFHIISLYFDISRPRLNWDNSIVAVKQNFNAVYSIFFAMGYSTILFFQTKYIFEINSNFFIKYSGLLVNKFNFLILSGLVFLLILVICENLLVYLFTISSLEKKFNSIEI
ncbi:MAG: hypothetical protein ACK4YF_02505 [Exilispira sp.]